MPGFLFNLIYLILLVVVSPALCYQCWKYGKYRDGWSQKLWGQLPLRTSLKRTQVWIHAVSVGEVLQLQQVIRDLRCEHQALDILVTTTTQSGYRVASEKLQDCQLAYFPLDFTWSVRNAIRRVQPDLIVLVELELWPNFLSAASSANIPVVLINGRLSERSFKSYQRVRWLFAPLLRQIEHIAVQANEYKSRFIALGVLEEQTVVTGSIKFDGVETDSQRTTVEELRTFFEIAPDEFVFIAGSTQEPEEAMALAAFHNVQQEFPHSRLIIVPRHPERRAAISRLIADAGYGIIRRSDRFQAGKSAKPVGLLDTIGELNDCWALADVAFVGGSFGNRGGQNMLEPAAYGAAVCFGPNTRNFKQIVELLLTQDCACTVNSQAELEDFIRKMFADRTSAQMMGQRAQQLILAQQGATRRTITLILAALSTAATKPIALSEAA